MYRTGGLVALLIGVVLTYMLVFTGFTKPLDSWRYTPDGGVERVKVACPAPWGILFGDALEEVEPAWQASRCVPSARMLVIEGVVVSVVSLVIGIWGISRGPSPPLQPLSVLPSARRH